MRFGPLTLPSNLFLSPLAGYTNLPFRLVVRELGGVGLCTTDLVNARSLLEKREKAFKLIETRPEDSPLAVQLFGSVPEEMRDAAVYCESTGVASIDINMGCPVRKVVNVGGGSAMMTELGKTAALVKGMVQAVRIPITAKMRLGWDGATINAPELARALEDVGVAAVTVHGRTRCQKYEGTADWAEIARVKDAVSIPVFGSGDVEDAETIARRIESGIVDGVVIARGMLGNFWFVRQAVHRLATGGHLPDLDFAERIALARRHLDMLCAYHGERRALRIGRKYVSWTIRGCAGAARLRAEVQGMDTRERLDALLDSALAAGPRPEGWFQPVFVSGEG